MLFAVFDVESVGLHGEGFAVGGVVVDGEGHAAGPDLYAACPHDHASADPDGRKWLKDNLPPLEWNCDNPLQVRNVFWPWWLQAKAYGALLAADVPWPVETNFLTACILSAGGSMWDPLHLIPSRMWGGPYPLIDVASVRLAAGLDPLAVEPRLDGELPIHNPLADARQSARLLVEALQATGGALDSMEAMHG